MKTVFLLLLTFVSIILSAQERYSVVISEIMADPSPSIGLPSAEWIELTNVSPDTINLFGWRIADANTQSGVFPSFLLAPGKPVIVCASSAVPALAPFGTAIGIGAFPSLDNATDELRLISQNGDCIHALAYEQGWYNNELKAGGGWSLEMIDVHQPCIGARNWAASNNEKGGTPGQINSVQNSITDDEAPQLLQAYAPDSITLILVFDEPLDSLQATQLSCYSMQDVNIAKALPLGPLFTKVQLQLSNPMQKEKLYLLTVQQVMDCKGNALSTASLRTGLAAPALPGLIIINELLFNPRPNAYDYIELFNNSPFIIDAAGLFLANRNSAGNIANIIACSPVPFSILPNEAMVITEDEASLSLNYLVKNPRLVLAASLPSFPDDKGAVLLLDRQGNILDELQYNEQWHFKLLHAHEGIALERVDPGARTQDESNWHSAASTAGFGTPTYKNSQAMENDNNDKKFSIEPSMFSPDNDGFNDQVRFTLTLNEPGYVANIVIYSMDGLPVRYLVKNATLGSTAYWNWDGLGNQGEKLPIGTYVVQLTAFNLQGKKLQFKKAVSLARSPW